MAFDSLSPAIRTTIGKTHPVPRKRLVDFERVTLTAGASTEINFALTAEMLMLITADGSSKSYAGVHEIIFSRGNGNDQVPVAVTV